MMKNFVRLLGLTLVCLALSACQIESDTQSELEQIKERGVLRVGTVNNQLAYFIGPNGPTGLEYDLAKRFADELGVKLEIKPSYQISGLFPALKRKEVDLVAAGLTHTPERLAQYRAGPAYYYVSQQIVYKKGTLRPRNLEQLIEQLQDPKVSFKVIQGSHYQHTLEILKQTHPKLRWTVAKNADTSGLLKQIEDDKLDFTLVDSVELSLSQRLHPNLAKAFEVTEDQPVSWFIRQDTDETLYALMIEFFGNLNQSGELAKLEEKYFGHVKTFDYVDTRAFIRSLDKKLPRYQDLFQKYAGDFDWRLIAALSYQESHWNPYATSPTGVRGMMMLTLPTAQSVNVRDRLDPEDSIRGGVEYLAKMVKRVPDSIPSHEKIWFALASYNIGFGHMMDARRLTAYEKGDPNSWTDVKDRLPKLEQSRYFNQTRYGYARGREAQKYVENIRRYYQTILAYLDENPSQTPQDDKEDFLVIDALLPEAKKEQSTEEISPVDEKTLDELKQQGKQTQRETSNDKADPSKTKQETKPQVTPSAEAKAQSTAKSTPAGEDMDSKSDPDGVKTQPTEAQTSD